MPRSPNRGRSPSSRERNNKRDYRYSHQDSEERYYGGESRKKVHRNDYYEEDQRDKRKQDDDRLKRKESYEQRPSIAIIEKEPYKQKRPSEPESEIKVHFRFKPIKVKLEPQHEEEILKLLKGHVSKKSQVEHFQKSTDSRPGYLVIEFGFRYDSDAFAYLKDKYSEIDLTIEKEKHNITAEPTKAFKFLIDENEEKKKRSGKERSESREDRRGGYKERERSKSKERPSKRSGKKRRQDSSSRSGSDSSSKSSSSSSSKSRRSSRRSKDRREEREYRKNPNRSEYKDRSKERYERERGEKEREREREQRRRSPESGGNYRRENGSSRHDIMPPSTSTHSLKEPSGGEKKYKTLYFFGIHYSVNLKEMDNLFYSHELGPFRHQEFLMRRMKNSICEYMEGRFEEKDISEKLEVKSHPFIVFECDSNEPEVLLSNISQFQVNLQFPEKIEPYHMLKWLKKCGRVIQIITLNKLTSEGHSEYYNITFNSKEVCDELKKMRHKDICVEEVTGDNVINVFRPNFKTELVPIDSDKYENKDNGKSSTYDKDNKSTNKDYGSGRTYEKEY